MEGASAPIFDPQEKYVVASVHWLFAGETSELYVASLWFLLKSHYTLVPLVFIFFSPFLYYSFLLLTGFFLLGHISQFYLFFALFFYLFYHLSFFSLFFSICANVFSFILLSFPWFRKRH